MSDIDNFIGVKMGKLTILSECRVDLKGKSAKGVVCKCECGKTISTYWFSVKYGLKGSCGCNYRPSLVGKRFGTLQVIGEGPIIQKHKSFICQCDCGNIRPIIGTRLTSGINKSCGCMRTFSENKIYRDHILYDVWKGMKARCRDKAHPSYKNYGARGVTVCKEWANDYLAFYNWAIQNGWAEGLQIDKDIKGNGKLYSPENCMFITAKVNSRAGRHIKIGLENAAKIRLSNKRYKDLANEYGVNISTISSIKRGKTWN